MDLVALLYSGQLSNQQAEATFDDTIAKVHRGESPAEWWDTLGMSEYEATAYLHGAMLSDLVKLRYEGWPNTCSRCGRIIDYKQYGWWFERLNDDHPHLRHIICPD